MADSEEDMDGREDNDGVNLTGFLFGNIDETGQLESDVFDTESQKHLASLGKYVLTKFTIVTVARFTIFIMMFIDWA